MLSKVLIVYFSGTGGTKRIADAWGKAFEQRNFSIFMHPLEKNTNPRSEIPFQDIHYMILLYPVYALEAPMPVYEWVRNLPQSFHIPTVVISVSGGGEVWPNTSCRVNVIKALKRKNYPVLYEKMMVMPANVFVKLNDHLAMHLIQCIPQKVEKMVSDILFGKTKRCRLHLSTYLFSLLHLEKKPNTLGKSLKVKDTCSCCGWCVKSCPQDNIQLKNNLPSFGSHCTACFRCIYGCPHQSIYIKNGSRLVHKDGYNIKALEKRMQNVALDPIEKCCKGILLLGVKKYLLDTP